MVIPQKSVVESLLVGRNMSELARKVGLSVSTIKACKNGLAGRILDYMGPDILVEIRRLPCWKNNLNAERELLACKYDRRH